MTIFPLHSFNSLLNVVNFNGYHLEYFTPIIIKIIDKRSLILSNPFSRIFCHYVKLSALGSTGLH